MASPASPLIHVGYVKTGSTWLQDHVTNEAALGLREVLSRRTITYSLIKPQILHYEPAPVAEEARIGIDSCIEEGLTPVVTHERLSGNPISGGYDIPIIAERLKELFPSARIVIVVREQRSHLKSIYAEYVNGGGACPLPAFLHPPEGAKLPLFDFRFLEFHRLIECYARLFGAVNLLVLPFEMFVREKQDFVNAILRHAGRPEITDALPEEVVRSSKSDFTIRVERFLNYLFYKDNSNPSAFFRSESVKRMSRGMDRLVPRFVSARQKRRVAEYIASEVGDRYRQSNAITDRYTDQSLERYGYDL